MTNAEQDAPFSFRDSGFVIDSSFVIRISSLLQPGYSKAPGDPAHL